MSSTGQIVGGIVGAVIGYFVGSPIIGAQIGMAIGGAIDPPKLPVIRGPRLDDLSVQTATYGAFIPRVYGTVAIHGNVFWVQGDSLIEREVVTDSGGKGGPTQTTETFEYFATFAVGLCEGPIAGVRRIWIGNQLWYDAGASDVTSIIASNDVAGAFTLYTGTDTQLADPLIQADKGAANVPAYRGLSYIVFDNLPLANYSNSLMGAQVKVEVANSLTDAPLTLEEFGAYDSIWHGTLKSAGNQHDAQGGFRNFVAYTPAPYYATTWYQFIDQRIVNSQVLVVSSAFACEPVMSALNDLAYAWSSANRAIWGADGHTYYCDLGTSQIVGAISDGGGNAYVLSYNGADGTRVTRVPISKSPAVTGIPLLVSHLGYVLHTLDYRALMCVWNGNAVVINRYGTSSIDQLLIQVFEPSSTNDSISMVDSFGILINEAAYDINVEEAVANIEGDLLTIVNVSTLGVCNVVVVNLTDKSVYKKWSTSIGTTALTTPILGSASVRGGAVYWSERSSVAGYGLMMYTLYSGVVTSGLATLSSIVSAECLKSKLLAASDIDVTELIDDVRGYRVAALGAIRAGLDPLRAAWPFDVVQAGYDIKFKKRGSASVATITAGELDAHAAGDSPGVSVTDMREMDLILPYKVGVKYLDTTREYDLNEQYAERLNTDAVNESAIDLPIVFTASEAAGKAETLLYLYWLERYDVMLTLPPSYAHLEPGDVITVEATFVTYELRLTSTHHLPDGRVDCRAKYNSASIYTPAAQGSEGLSIGATLTLAGPTVYVLLDIPLLRDDDDTAGFPVAMTGYLSGWPGGVLFRSEDGGETWMDLAGFVSPGTVMGYATNSLAAHGGTVYDFASTLTVWLYQGTLSSITEAQLFAAQNWFAYGKDGRWEIIAAKTATLQGDGSYILQDFLRGQLGTEWATGLHVANDSFVRLSAADLEFVSVNASTIGGERNYRGITAGKTLDSDSNRAFTYNGVNLECLSPVHATGNRHPSTNDWTLTWVRRTRFSGWRDLVDAVLGETTESYEVDVYSSSAYTTLKRTLTSATQTGAYTSANQVTDFGSNQATLYLKIYQLSATVGRGYPLTISITR